MPLAGSTNHIFSLRIMGTVVHDFLIGKCTNSGETLRKCVTEPLKSNQNKRTT